MSANARSVKDLLGKLLVTDPAQRYSAAQALAHPWLNSPIDETSLDMTRANMRRHLARRRFKVRTGSNGLSRCVMVQCGAYIYI